MYIFLSKSNKSFIPNPSFGCYETSISNYFIQQKPEGQKINISTHPNPINENDLLSLIVNIETTSVYSNYHLILTDILGKSFTYKLSNIDGTNQYKLNTDALQFISRGIYFGVIKQDNETIGTI
jgi:hypothetical protein